ncbi:TPA: hypothetical protein ACWROZ_001224, partial [Staphylococcus aureus]
MLGPRQLALFVEIGNPTSLCWGPPQLALSVEFPFEILFVGAPLELKKACYKRIFFQSTTANITL